MMNRSIMVTFEQFWKHITQNFRLIAWEVDD